MVPGRWPVSCGVGKVPTGKRRSAVRWRWSAFNCNVVEMLSGGAKCCAAKAVQVFIGTALGHVGCNGCGCQFSLLYMGILLLPLNVGPHALTALPDARVLFCSHAGLGFGVSELGPLVGRGRP